VTHTLSVSLVVSDGELISGSQADALGLNSICYVDGEILAFQTATLTGPNAYGLTYLVRGAYDTDDAMETSHPSGSAFTRLDQGILKVPFDQSRIGATLDLKFQPFNIWGGGMQSLADIPAFTYVIQGAALYTALPDITNLRTVFIDGVTNLSWDEVTDFRTVRYEIRLGASADSAMSLGTVAHPPFAIPGNGTYWVAAVAEPSPGRLVYSDNWQTVTVTGATLVSNVIASWDEKATLWTGTFTGGAGVDGTAIRTGGGGDILSLADFLHEANILDFGGEVSGSYTIPTSHIINVGYVAACLIGVKFLPTGVPVGSDILTIPDFLNTPDILGSASTQYIKVRPQINVSQDGVIYAGWQDFTPGVYLGQSFNFRLLLETVDPNTICYCLEFSFSVDVPDRVDSFGIISAVRTSLTGVTLAAGGTAITYVADTETTATPFNGGPGGATTPNVQVTIRNANQGDDVVVSVASLSGCTAQVTNAGVGVVRQVDIRPQGY